MLVVTTIIGETEALTDYKEFQIKRRVNSERSLSFILISTERNSHSYPLVQEESIVEYRGQKYRIKQATEKTIGDHPIKQVRAHHIMFDLIDKFQYEVIQDQEITIQAAMNHTLANTPYTFDIVDPFYPEWFDDFGNENSLTLLNTILDTFKAEVDANNTHLTIRQKIGRETDFQFRYKHNLKTINKNVDTSNLSTYIRGYADVSDFGIYMVEAEYPSPLAEVYGIRHAPPVYADDLVYESSLLERLQETLNDKPDISFTIEFTELKKAGFPYEVAEVGDTVYIIYEPLGIDITARIVEYIEYPEEPKASTVTLANFEDKITDIIADTARQKQRLDKVLNEKGKVRYNFLEAAVQRATEALNNAMTELEFPEGMGIIARDPTDANKFLALRSNGLGITEDGGQTFREAITTAGFVLTAGVIGQLSANNIDVSGVIQLFNSEGTTFIDGGKIDIQGKVLTDELSSIEQQFTVMEGEISSKVSQSIYNADINDAANGLKSRMSEAEQKITSEAIVSTVRTSTEYADDLASKASVSSITQLAEEIGLKVSQEDFNGDTIATELTLSPSAMELISENINLTGKVTFSSLDSTLSNTIDNKVSVSQLSTAGQTIINGANITTGIVSADHVSTNIQQVNSSLNIGSLSSMGTVNFHAYGGRYAKIYGWSDLGEVRLVYDADVHRFINHVDFAAAYVSGLNVTAKFG